MAERALAKQLRHRYSDPISLVHAALSGRAPLCVCAKLMLHFRPVLAINSYTGFNFRRLSRITEGELRSSNNYRAADEQLAMALFNFGRDAN